MRRLAAVNIAVKVLLVAFLGHGVLYPDLPQYQGKGMGWRLLLYPLTALLVPLVWRLRGRRPQPFPHHIDLVVALPFLLDTARNTFDLCDSITSWDDFMHVLTWIPWVMVAGFIARSSKETISGWRIRTLPSGVCWNSYCRLLPITFWRGMP